MPLDMLQQAELSRRAIGLPTTDGRLQRSIAREPLDARLAGKCSRVQSLGRSTDRLFRLELATRAGGRARPSFVRIILFHNSVHCTVQAYIPAIYVDAPPSSTIHQSGLAPVAMLNVPLTAKYACELRCRACETLILASSLSLYTICYRSTLSSVCFTWMCAVQSCLCVDCIDFFRSF